MGRGSAEVQARHGHAVAGPPGHGTERVERARAVGAGNGHIILHHLLPVLTPLIFANLILTVSYSIFTESFLAFFGLEDPSVSSWGTMIQLSYMNADFVRGAWWAILPPGLCITSLVLAFAMISFVLEEAVNPRLRGRTASGPAAPERA